MPLAVMVDGPPAQQFPEELATTHANLVQQLVCSMADTSAQTADGSRQVSLAAFAGIPAAAAVVLETPDGQMSSLDQQIPAEEGTSFYGGTSRLEDLAAPPVESR